MDLGWIQRRSVFFNCISKVEKLENIMVLINHGLRWTKNSFLPVQILFLSSMMLQVLIIYIKLYFGIHVVPRTKVKLGMLYEFQFPFVFWQDDHPLITLFTSLSKHFKVRLFKCIFPSLTCLRQSGYICEHGEDRFESNLNPKKA